MLIRFIVKNFLSFKEETEFNLLPGRGTRFNHHKYDVGGIPILKLSAIYGANGSGKSNLIKAISTLRSIVILGEIPSLLLNQKFKLTQSLIDEPIDFGIEFYCKQSCYFYSTSINQKGEIIHEYLAETNASKEKLIFHRTFDGQTASIKFFDGFDRKQENIILKKLIETDLIKSNQVLLSFLNKISNEEFDNIKDVHEWFEKGLTIIGPQTKATTLPHEIDSNSAFRKFSNETMSSFNTGINEIKTQTIALSEIIGKDNQKEIENIKNKFIANPERISVWENKITGERHLLVYQNEDVFAKKMLFHHKGEKNENIVFDFTEESDGTKRLWELLPAFFLPINFSQTIIVDEIERSIHPLIIKELISKFSHDENTKGQLIFSTHESNLLDQDIFRADEIWFAEKGSNGATRLYSLNDFKEHNTIDIRKGYLSGRYGGIPFLGNLHDLNWDKE